MTPGRRVAPGDQRVAGFSRVLQDALRDLAGPCESKLHIGVGYRNDADEYELVAVEAESWMEAAGLLYDELGQD